MCGMGPSTLKTPESSINRTDRHLWCPQLSVRPSESKSKSPVLRGERPSQVSSLLAHVQVKSEVKSFRHDLQVYSCYYEKGHLVSSCK